MCVKGLHRPHPLAVWSCSLGPTHPIKTSITSQLKSHQYLSSLHRIKPRLLPQPWKCCRIWPMLSSPSSLALLLLLQPHGLSGVSLTQELLPCLWAGCSLCPDRSSLLLMRPPTPQPSSLSCHLCGGFLPTRWGQGNVFMAMELQASLQRFTVLG